MISLFFRFCLHYCDLWDWIWTRFSHHSWDALLGKIIRAQQKIENYRENKKTTALQFDKAQTINEQLCIQFPQGGEPFYLCTYFKASLIPINIHSDAAWHISVRSSHLQVKGNQVSGDPRQSAKGYGATINMSSERYFQVMEKVNGIADAWMNGSIPSAIGITPLDYSHPLDEVLKADLAIHDPIDKN